ncbi:hypothetical protein E4U21_004551 [Claviceps maximensis]|nr:hypothetical protein E4U21_004551 [Claviceps maximensis]
MRLPFLYVLLGTAAVTVSEASASHQRAHQVGKRLARHHGGHIHSRAETNAIVKRGTCAFPTDDPNLVAVTPEAMNAGWAMSPDQECRPGDYCPIACKPGMVMAQWKPGSSYKYPDSMFGGLYCDNNGNVQKPFPQRPNCVPGTGTVKAVNECQGQVSWCQTILPGNEAMLIPTLVTSEATVAVPDISYWAGTAAHFYINPPGVGVEGCIWGTEVNPIGNWAPYVAGANTDASGRTFLKIGWNPIWLESAPSFSKPSFGIRIECPDGGCVGLPCEINPSSDPIGSVVSKLSAIGAGNAAFCVVTVAKGSTARVVTFNVSGGSTKPNPDPKKNSPPPPPPPPPTPESVPPTTTSSTPLPHSTTCTSSASTSVSLTSSHPSTHTPKPARRPGVFREMDTDTDTSSDADSTTSLPSSSSSSSTSTSPTTTTTTTTTAASSSSSSSSLEPVAVPTAPGAPKTIDEKGGAGRRQGSAAAGLFVAFIVASYVI